MIGVIPRDRCYPVLRYLILAELMISFYSTKILHHPHQMGHLVKHKKTAQQLNILTLKINILFGGPQFM